MKKMKACFILERIINEKQKINADIIRLTDLW